MDEKRPRWDNDPALVPINLLIIIAVVAFIVNAAWCG